MVENILKSGKKNPPPGAYRIRLVAAILLGLSGLFSPAAPQGIDPPDTPAESPAPEGGASRLQALSRPVELDSTATLDDYIEYAIRNNPSLKAYDELARAASQVPAQVSSYPDPILSYGYFAKNVETRVGPQEDSWMLSQKFPFFGKLGLREDIAEKDASIARRTYETRLLDLVKRVKETYYEYYRVYYDTKLYDEERKVLGYMQSVAQVKYASGKVGQQDVLKAQLALSKIDVALTRLEREMTTVKARLNELLNRPPDSPLAPPRPPAAPADRADMGAAFRVAREWRPELRSAGLAIEKASKMRSLARREYFPDFTISMQYTRVGERPMATLPENGEDAVFLKASINLPLWLGKRRAAVREAEARILAARHVEETISISIESEVEDALTKVKTAQELVELYEGVIIPQAEQTFRASEAGYRTGEVDFLDYLDSERMLLAVRRAYYAVVADLGKQVAYYERVVGKDMTRIVEEAK